MSVPGPASGSAAKGRRQHHRSAVVGHATEELVYLSGRVPRALRDELHIRAIQEGRPVVDLLRDAIRAYLDRGGPR
jgi:hypothetical protein